MAELIDYLKHREDSHLGGYTGNDVTTILDILRDHKHWDDMGPPDKNKNSKNHSVVRRNSGFVDGDSKSNNGNAAGDVIHSPVSLGDVTHSRNNASRLSRLGTSHRSRARHRARTLKAANTSNTDVSVNSTDVTDSTCYRQCMERVMADEVPHQSPGVSHHAQHNEHDTLHEVAHGLHFASIAILGFLVVEVSDIIMYCGDVIMYCGDVIVYCGGVIMYCGDVIMYCGGVII